MNAFSTMYTYQVKTASEIQNIGCVWKTAFHKSSHNCIIWLISHRSLHGHTQQYKATGKSRFGKGRTLTGRLLFTNVVIITSMQSVPFFPRNICGTYAYRYLLYRAAIVLHICYYCMTGKFNIDFNLTVRFSLQPLN